MNGLLIKHGSINNIQIRNRNRKRINNVRFNGLKRVPSLFVSRFRGGICEDSLFGPRKRKIFREYNKRFLLHNKTFLHCVIIERVLWKNEVNRGRKKIIK